MQRKRDRGIVCCALVFLVSALCAAAAEDQGSVEASGAHENLDGGFSDWSHFYLTSSYRFSGKQVVYGTLSSYQRFDLEDNELLAGYYHPLAQKTTLWIEAAGSPEHAFLPRWTTMAALAQEFGGGWIGHIALRHTDYPHTTTRLASASLESYWGQYRAAYTIYSGRPEGAGSATSHRLEFQYFYGDTDSVELSVSAGKENENVGRIVTTDVRSLTLGGHHGIGPKWSLVYALNWHEQGDLYTRRGISLGVKRSF
jgi:YaiO family outer membrane protein